MALPPARPSDSPASVVLALHGAGVEAESPFWTGALGGRLESSWVIFPTGRSAWGYDWHGPSALSALATRQALSSLVNERFGQAWAPGPGTILVGHSNGGQCHHISSTKGVRSTLLT